MNIYFKKFFSVTFLTFISRIFGFIRDNIIVQVFGVNFATDAFYTANKIPNLLRRIFAEGAFSQAFIPIFINNKKNKTKQELILFIQNITGILSLLLLIVTIIGIIFAPFIIYVFSRGFVQDQIKFQLTVKILRIVFPYIFFISLTSLMSSILNAYNVFSITAITPILLNISLIVFALCLRNYFNPSILAIAVAVFVGGLIQLIFQLPFIYKFGYLKIPKLDFNIEVKEVFKKMLPAIFGVSISQMSIFISSFYQSFLETGSVSWIYQADRLMEFPTALLGTTLITVLLPSLSKFASNKNNLGFANTVNWGIKISLLLSMPCAVGMLILSYPIISTLFMYNEFKLYDALNTQKALIAYAIGLVPLILIKLLNSSFYAYKNIKTPVKIASISLIFTIIFNSIFFILNFGVFGIALSISLGAYINVFLLLCYIQRYNIYNYKNDNNIFSFFMKISFCSIIMGIVLWYVKNQSFIKLNWEANAVYKVLQLISLIIVGIITYFFLILALKINIKKIFYYDS